MKKILIAFDGRHFSQGAFDFVRVLNDKQPVLAVGVFLPVVDYAELLYSLGGMSGPMYYQDYETDDIEVIKSNIDHFKTLCLDNNIEYRVHPDLERHVISEIKEESRYADLLVISSELFYENLGEDVQDDYIESVLHKAECPVVMVPERYRVPENIILAYDGSEYSVYAIKQFAYLFPEFAMLKTLLIYAGTKEIPQLPNIQELATHHFENLTVQKLELNPKTYFDTWLTDNGNSILVTGAYGRSVLSEMLKASFVHEIIHDHRIPVFVAHK